MILTLLCLLVLPAALASPEAEVVRLSEEMNRLAQRTAWSGVERKYQEMLELRKAKIPGQVHLLAAQSARQQGDVAEAHRRAQRALATEPLEPEILNEASAWLADFLVNYGEVQIDLSVAFRGAAKITALDGAGFSPKVRDAINVVNSSLLADRTYTRFLPIGRYRIGSTAFDIYGGPVVKVFVKPEKEASAGAPVPLPDERPPDRIITLAVRGGGWKADDWESIVKDARISLYDVDGVMTVDAFQPDAPWIVATPDQEQLRRYDLDMVQLASTLQLALDIHRLVVTDDTLAFPPETANTKAVERAIIAFHPTEASPDAPVPIHLSEVASVEHRRHGPFPMPSDNGAVAQHRFEVKVRGGTDAVEKLLPALSSLQQYRALGLMMEAQEVR